MSWLKAAVVAMTLLAFSVEASAGGRVDWSAYIDHDAKPSAPRNTASSSESASVTPKKAKATKVSKKKKAATKNRKARSKKSRRK